MYKVLIVENDPMVAMIHEQNINRSKNFCAVGKCADGNSALTFLESNMVDLMILDVFAPRLNGFEVLRQIREKQIPVDVIIVTAANDRETLEEALRLGVVDYIVKPFSLDRFQVALDRFIAQNNALRNFNTLDQKNIDFIIDATRRESEIIFPKGIQERTLSLIIDFLKGNRGQWMTGDDISENICLTSVTVRRYMNYLSESGRAIGKMDYKTGGRPRMIYRFVR